jgi:hypothetical protein
MEKLHKAYKRATTDATLFMTAELRSRARSEGWDEKVVNKLRVVKKDDTYSVKFPASVGDQAWIHEYGDPENTPTATIRKFDANPSATAKFLGERMMHHLGGND